MYPHMGAALPPLMGIPPPPMPMPVPIAVPFAIRFEQPLSTTSTSTSTTTSTSTSTAATAAPAGSADENIAVAVPIALPMPIHMAIPAFPPPTNCQAKPRPYNCPPCPPCMCSPSCTPAFFSYCSACHQMCKCRNNAVAPPPPPRYHVIPYHSKSSHSEDTYSSDESSSTSSELDSIRRKTKRRKNRKRLHNMRRNFQLSDIETSDSEIIKPVLTYISKNGDIKFKKRISSAEVAHLLGERRSNKPHQIIKLMRGEDSNGKSQVVIISKDAEEAGSGYRRRQVMLKEGYAKHVLGAGKKELIFQPADDKKISNFSVSFHVVS